MGLLVAGLRQEVFLCDSVIGAMTVAKLIHQKDKVMQGGVAVAEEGVLEQWLFLLAVGAAEVVVLVGTSCCRFPESVGSPSAEGG